MRSVGRGDWAAIEALFGGNGACGGCWCMWPRREKHGAIWTASKGEPNRRAFEKLVKSGHVHGLFAMEGERIVGWCCLGPRADFPRLERMRAARTEWDESTWSVVCFFIPNRERGKGVASALLDAAIEYAREHGAKTLEGYPVRGANGQTNMPAAFAWTGVVGMFEQRGFERCSPKAARELWKRGLVSAPKRRKAKREAP